MEDDDFISKSERKRRMTALQRLGEELVELSPDQLARLALPEDLREAVLECRRLTRHEAIRRQMQYIGKLMRDLDAAPIASQLAQMQAPSRMRRSWAPPMRGPRRPKAAACRCRCARVSWRTSSATATSHSV